MRILLFTLWAILGLSLPAAAEDSSAPHWSLRPVTQSPAPPGNGQPIDRFILARLAEAELSPNPAADPETLLRRLHFALTGLPPSLAEIDAFLSAWEKDRETAVSGAADRLLASPHFGEKWARHWLDLARYAESNGKDRDVVFPDAWRYRDYIINAFNADKPINTFIREQIAGDLLPGAGDEQKIASAFLALGPKAFEETNDEKFRMEVVDEQIDVLSRSILGMTVACARCHDHKFDPVPMSDYYSLAGILLSSDTRYGPGPLYTSRHDKDTDLVPIGDRVADLHPAVAKWRREIVETTEKVTRLRSDAYRIQRDVDGELRERKLKKAEDAPDLFEKEKKRLAMRAEADELNAKRLAMIKNPPAEQPGYTMAVLRSAKKPADCAIRVRGVHDDHGEKVRRGQLSLPGMPDFEKIGPDESGRLQLAQWLASDRNPLTARVFVNRVWHHLFGAGLARTVDNFGITGEKPSHPKLLDFLAAEFIADGWSLKKLARRIVLSRTWQASSREQASNRQIDPENRLLWRANFRRLDIEAFRDALLSVSGQLDRSPRDGSLFGHTYAGMDYGAASDHVVNFDKEIAADRHRTIYLPLARNAMPAFLGLFDFADPAVPMGARHSRTIPAQALYLMNNPFMEEQSRAAAERIQKFPERERLEITWRITTGKKPDAETLKMLQGALAGKADQTAAWTDLMQMLFASAPFRYLE